MSSLYDSYTNLVEIGRGGMATVYRATSKQTGQLVAIKVLDMHLMNDTAARARFAQEASFTLVHPNIVRVVEHEVDSRGSTPYIVMEYVAGESLEQELQREGPQPLPQVLPVLRDIGHALDYAHSQGVIHRDVKPNNMLIRATTGQAMLADFGIAKTASLTAYTQTLQRVGSVLFMSPEQASGAPNLTPASDIYSLGVSTYYALSGRHPFEGEDQIAVARMHIDAAPPHLSDLNPNIPREWGDVVMQTLNKQPAQRPATASQFTQNLELALQRTPTLAASAANAAAIAASNLTPTVLPRMPGANNGIPRPATSAVPKAVAKPVAPRSSRRLPAAVILLGGLIGLLLCALLGLFTGLLGGGGSGGVASPARTNGSGAATTTAAALGATSSAVAGTAAASGTTGTPQSPDGTSNPTDSSTRSPEGEATRLVTAAPNTAVPPAPTRSGTIMPNQTPLTDFIDTIPRPGAPTRAPGSNPTPVPPFVTVGPVGPPTLIVIGASPLPPTPVPPTPTPGVIIYPTSFPTRPPILPPTPVFPTRTPFPPSATPLPSATATSLPTATPTMPPTATPTLIPTDVPTVIPPLATPVPTATELPSVTPEPPTVEPTITIVP